MSMHASEMLSKRGTAGAVFAAILMFVGGVMNSLQGLAGIIKNTFYVISPNYWVTFSTTTWGWIHLAIGVVLLLAGVTVLTGATWARWLGIVIASIAAVGNFMFIPIQPFWALALLALDIWVVYSLVVHKREPEMIYLNPGTASETEVAPVRASEETARPARMT